MQGRVLGTAAQRAPTQAAPSEQHGVCSTLRPGSALCCGGARHGRARAHDAAALLLVSGTCKSLAKCAPTKVCPRAKPRGRVPHHLEVREQSVGVGSDSYRVGTLRAPLARQPRGTRHACMRVLRLCRAPEAPLQQGGSVVQAGAPQGWHASFRVGSGSYRVAPVRPPLASALQGWLAVTAAEMARPARLTPTAQGWLQQPQGWHAASGLASGLALCWQRQGSGTPVLPGTKAPSERALSRMRTELA